jgi:hypothetical protein
MTELLVAMEIRSFLGPRPGTTALSKPKLRVARPEFSKGVVGPTLLSPRLSRTPGAPPNARVSRQFRSDHAIRCRKRFQNGGQ